MAATTVAVTGASSALGRAVVPALVAAGHDVLAVVRSPQRAAVLAGEGVRTSVASVFDAEALEETFRGCQTVVNLATHVPVGPSARWPWAWRLHDRLRTDGVRRVAGAARAAGVRRLVQESASFLYADQGSQWVTEDSPVDITCATEPVSVGEACVQEFADTCRTGVVLRLGRVVGDDEATRWSLRAAAARRPVAVGPPDGWVHVVHTDDIGGAVLAALSAPSGIYNVGAEPVRRADLAAGYASAVGHDRGELAARTPRKPGSRMEPLSRSLRVSSSAFTSRTGWSPRRGSFDASWLDAAAPSFLALR